MKKNNKSCLFVVTLSNKRGFVLFHAHKSLWNITHWAFKLHHRLTSMLFKILLSLPSWTGFASGPLENRITHTHANILKVQKSQNVSHVMFISEQSHLCVATTGSIKGAQLAFCFMFPGDTFAPKTPDMENVIRHERLHASQLILSRWQTRWGNSTVTHYNTPAGPTPDRVSLCGFHNYGCSVTNLCHSNYPPRSEWSR